MSNKFCLIITNFLFFFKKSVNFSLKSWEQKQKTKTGNRHCKSSFIITLHVDYKDENQLSEYQACQGLYQGNSDVTGM